MLTNWATGWHAKYGSQTGVVPNPGRGGDQQRIEEQPAVEKTIAETVKAQSEQERK